MHDGRHSSTFGVERADVVLNFVRRQTSISEEPCGVERMWGHEW